MAWKDPLKPSDCGPYLEGPTNWWSTRIKKWCKLLLKQKGESKLLQEKTKASVSLRETPWLTSSPTTHLLIITLSGLTKLLTRKHNSLPLHFFASEYRPSKSFTFQGSGPISSPRLVQPHCLNHVHDQCSINKCGLCYGMKLCTCFQDVYSVHDSLPSSFQS